MSWPQESPQALNTARSRRYVLARALHTFMGTPLMLFSRRQRSISTLAALWLGACGTIEPYDVKVEEPATWEPGGSEGFDIVEAGQLRDAELLLSDSVPAFRVESFGSTQLEIWLAGGEDADAYLVVEGPLPGHGDAVAPGDGEIYAIDDDSGDGTDALLSVTLTAPGVYRVIAGTYATMARGESVSGEALTLGFACDASCRRPTMGAKQLLEHARASNKLDEVVKAAHQHLALLAPDPLLAADLRAQLDAIVASPTFEGIERFPTVPAFGLGTLRPAIGLIPGDAPSPDAVVSGQLTELLGDCKAVRATPAELSPTAGGVGVGYFADRTLTPCQVSHSKRLAQILTSLAADNGSAIAYDGGAYTQPQDLLRALIESGHSVQVRDERTFASFIALTVGDDDVRWPVWLDTGIDIGVSKSRLVVPAGHSHHAWRISGPTVDARVMFYLGTGGPAFTAQTALTPMWSGTSTVHAALSGSEHADDYIVHTVDVATAYLRKFRVESDTVGAGLPSGGYGFLGTSTDANAVIEMATRGQVRSFPLLRAASLDNELSLPSDGDATGSHYEALVRVLAMVPHDLASEHIWDEALRQQLKAAAAIASTPPAVQ